MSLVEALIDCQKRSIHAEVREVVKEYEDSETFIAVGDLLFCSLEYVGHGDSGYYGKVYDRLDKRVYMEIYISHNEYEKVENFHIHGKEKVEVCVWGVKRIRKFASTKRNKKIIEITYKTSLVLYSDFFKKFDMF